MHPTFSLLPEYRWPENEPYNLHPSTKIDALLAILQHHLATPDAPTLVVKEDAAVPNTLVPDPDYMATDAAPGSSAGVPDRIIVYLAFPKNNWVIYKVRTSRTSVVSILIMITGP